MDESSAGICERLMRFFVGVLRRPSALPAASTQVLVEEEEEWSAANGGKDSEIVVEFRHTDTADSAVVLSTDQNGMNRKQAKGKGMKRKKEANHSAGQATALALDHDDDDDDDTKSRRHWPLLNVTSNINEKSEAFIERKKKAMTRNYSLDQDHHK
ncbi:hypothetical protein C2S53_016792 [Perilla frutescens var. hirtella]|uniref:Uncharacterized protein n=1 Tax=Perilla frutescens var. hirtella TaxID=608512 RepID=A0AAD4IUH2_PERFH|nr:hypothetical protein C2S53_016792 [Perilla frutescens var. hirtella]